jgi:ATP-dependent exoDNAse (exonuclease V) beta subunit
MIAASPSEETWWIIDYKTAHEDSLDAVSALPELRRQFAPQIEAYAAVLRNLRGAEIRLCGGLYYPRMALFDWWQM